MERFTGGGTGSKPEQIQEIQKLCQENLDGSIQDPVLRQKLQPNYRAGCKRLIYSPDYYKAIQQPGSELITDGISQIEKSGVRTSDGVLHEVDIIVLATGFKTDRYVRPMDVTGLQGKTLEQAWSDVPAAYKSIRAGLPQLLFHERAHIARGQLLVDRHIRDAMGIHLPVDRAW